MDGVHIGAMRIKIALFEVPFCGRQRFPIIVSSPCRAFVQFDVKVSNDDISELVKMPFAIQWQGLAGMGDKRHMFFETDFGKER